MELFIAAFIVVVALAGAVVVAARSQVHAQQGWLAAERAEREVRYLLTARVTTLENRVDARSWGEFEALQSVHDETTKVGWAEQAHTQADPAFLEAVQSLRDQGATLEGEDSYEEGPILG